MIALYANSRVVKALTSFCLGGRLPHAALFEGPAGSGKKTAAKLFAQMALCTAQEKPCGVCAHCVKVEKQIHPDVCVYSVPEGKKEFPIDLIRTLRQDAYILPNEGSCKVYILDQAHAMNASAQNALLKLLEEPPAHVRLVLLSENRSSMLDTILSRTLTFELRVPDVGECAEILRTLAAEATQSACLAAAENAQGNIGRALELLGQAKPSRTAADAEKLLQLLVLDNRYQALRLLANYDKDREGLSRLFALFAEMVAQLALARHKLRSAPVSQEQERLAARVSVAQADRMIQAVDTALRRVRQNVGIPLLCACFVEEIKTVI